MNRNQIINIIFHTFLSLLSLYKSEIEIMRYTSYLFLLVLVLSSCSIYSPGNGKLRYVRSEKGEISIVERSEKGHSIATQDLEKENVLVVENSTEILSQQNESLRDEVNKEVIDSDKVSNEKVSERAEPKDLNPDLDERIIDEAYEAERAANTSFILMLVGLISAFAPYLGIIPFIIGLIFYTKSDRSRYITQFGERKQQSARVVMIIDTIILSLWLLLIVALFFI